MVCDFKVIEHIMGDYIETLDHAMCINTADSAYGELRARYGDRIVSFENEDPTTEVLARVIFQTFTKKWLTMLQRMMPIICLRRTSG